MKCLEDSNVVTQLCQVACAGQACRAGTNHSNLLAILLFCCFRNKAVLSGPVSHETLQLTDGDRLTLDAADALTLTLALLRAYTAADCRKCGRLSNHIRCSLEVSGFYFFNESRNVDGNWASAHTFCVVLTFQASGSLFHSLFFVISIAHFLKVGSAHLCVLLSDRSLL